MKKIKLVLLISLIIMSCVKEEKKSENFELVKLSKGVYGCIHKFGGKAICNSGIVDNGIETIIFDTFLSPEVSEELIDLVKSMGLSPIKYVINSHGHNDHIRGNQSFNSAVEIISTKKTLEKIEKEEAKAINSEKKFGKLQFEELEKEMRMYKGDTTSREYIIMKMMKPYFEELSESHKKIKTRLPNSIVERKKEIKGKLIDIKLIEFDSSHTVSDLVMYLPKEKILFSGDIIFNDFHPYLGDGDHIKLKNTLKELEKLEIEKIVPGHGETGGKELISKMINYIDDLNYIVDQGIANEKSLEEMKRQGIARKYEKWWLDNFYAMNLKYLYESKVNN